MNFSSSVYLFSSHLRSVICFQISQVGEMFTSNSWTSWRQQGRGVYLVYVPSLQVLLSPWQILQMNFPRGKKNSAFFGTIFPSISVSSLRGRADEWRIGAEARHVTPQLSSANDGGKGTKHCSGTARAALEIRHQWQMMALGRSTASLRLCGTFVQHGCRVTPWLLQRLLWQQWMTEWLSLLRRKVMKLFLEFL